MWSFSISTERKIVIQKPKQEIIKLITDFTQWQRWSPWLCQDKNCKVTVEGSAGSIGHKQTWDGPIVGAGSTELKSIESNVLHFTTNFLKPWKSTSQNYFRLKGDEKNCEITWQFSGSLPFFFIFFKKMFISFIGNDFERGLKMMKEMAEDGLVSNQIEVLGIQEATAFHYLGMRTKCQISEVGAHMTADFTRLREMAEKGIIDKPERYLSLYEKFDFTNGACEYIAAAAYSTKPRSAPEMGQGTVPIHQAIKVNHTGSYEHLGNAWATAWALQRHLKRRPSRQLKMYEVYFTNPTEVDEKSNRSQVLIPLG